VTGRLVGNVEALGSDKTLMPHIHAMRILLMAAAAIVLCWQSPAAGQETRRGRGSPPSTRPAAQPAGMGSRLAAPFGRATLNPIERARIQISASEEEWKVIRPKLMNVMAARRLVDGDWVALETSMNAEFVGESGPPDGARGGAGAGGPGGPGDGRGGSFGPGRGGGMRTGGPGAERNNPTTQPTVPPSPRPGLFRSILGGGRGPGPGGGPPPPREERPISVAPLPDGPLGQAKADLKAALDDPKTPDEEIRKRVAALRSQRQKARADLDAAQKDLLLLLTADQEAVLVSLGYLD